MAVGSGNSACTRCWLSEALWLFPRSPGASGPTAGGFYRPSGLGTDSGSAGDGGVGKEKELVMCTHRGINWFPLLLPRSSPVPSLQLLVCGTVLCRNQGLSVRHRAQRMNKSQVCRHWGFFAFKKGPRAARFYH